MQKTSLPIYLNLTVIYLVWGSTFLGVRYALEVLPPVLASSLRFLVGGSILFFVAMAWQILKKQPPILPTFQQTWGAVQVGILLVGMGNTALSYAIKFMPTGLVALLVATLPVWTVVLDFLLFSKLRPHRLTVAGLGLSMIGMGVLLNPFSGINRTDLVWFPAILVLVGAISWAYGSLRAPHLQMPPPLQSTAIQMLAGGTFALIISAFTEIEAWQSVENMTLTTYLAMGYLIFIGSFLGYSSYNWLMHHAPPALVATYAYVNPVVAIFLGWLFLNESLSKRALIASAIILTGVMLITLGKRYTRR
ncbi:MAG: EamA family transporter [Cytophagales bacterium]|nr:EamA family transporter [Bernardetiaceae bacterium]MDW8205250.1 EamA family transporter [Cytophagales bacterium]